MKVEMKASGSESRVKVSQEKPEKGRNGNDATLTRPTKKFGNSLVGDLGYSGSPRLPPRSFKLLYGKIPREIGHAVVGGGGITQFPSSALV